MEVDCFFNPTRGTYDERLGTPQLAQQLRQIQQKYPDWDIFTYNTTCGICGKPIQVKKRFKNRGYKHNNYCLECRTEKRREWARNYYRRNKERVMEYQREYRVREREKVLEWKRRSGRERYWRKKIMRLLPGVWEIE